VDSKVFAPHATMCLIATSRDKCQFYGVNEQNLVYSVTLVRTRRKRKGKGRGKGKCLS
jgi:hypothetical protein